MARCDFYQYRGWPCTAGPWYVSGEDHHDGWSCGVLEWCNDEADAKGRMRIMALYPQFKNLNIGKCED